MMIKPKKKIRDFVRGGIPKGALFCLTKNMSGVIIKKNVKNIEGEKELNEGV